MYQRKYMLRYCILLVSVFITVKLFSQDNFPAEVDSALLNKINLQVQTEAATHKKILTAQKKPPVIIEFMIDTFKIDAFVSKYIAYDYSTVGMRSATYTAATKFDSLLNKYYKKLLAVLKPVDKTALINAQKSWINFRDNELKLIETISKDEYSGGGTIQQLIDADAYLSLIRERTEKIFDYYLRATQTNEQ